MEELVYLKQAKGNKTNKVVKSQTFWKNVDTAVNFFEPLANMLRRMDSDIPSMGFFHGLMLEAKKEISERFDNNNNCFKEVWEIIDKKMGQQARNSTTPVWLLFELPLLLPK